MNGTQDREIADGDTPVDTDDAPPRPPEVMACLRVVGILFGFLLVPALVIRALVHCLGLIPFSWEQLAGGWVVAGLLAFSIVGWQLVLEPLRPRWTSGVRVLGGALGFLPTLAALTFDAREWVGLLELALWYPLCTGVLGIVFLGPSFVGWSCLLLRAPSRGQQEWSFEKRRAVGWKAGGISLLAVSAGLTGPALYLRDEASPDVEGLLARLPSVPLEENGLVFLAESAVAHDFGERLVADEWKELPRQLSDAMEAELVDLLDQALRLPFGPFDDSVESDSPWDVVDYVVRNGRKIPMRAVSGTEGHRKRMAASVRDFRIGRRLVERCGLDGIYRGQEVCEVADRRLASLLGRGECEGEQLAELHAVIVAERISFAALAGALAAEYRRVAHDIDDITRLEFWGGTKPPLLLWWMRSKAVRPNRTKRLVANWVRDVLAAAKEAPTRRRPSGARDALGTRLREIVADFRRSGMTIGLWLHDDEWFLEPYDQIRCRDALLDTLLAVLLYEHDHGGLPASLEDLVPAYAAEVPADPYTGGPLHYDRDARVVYSLGPYGIDRGPSEESDAADALLDEYTPTARIP